LSRCHSILRMHIIQLDKPGQQSSSAAWDPRCLHSHGLSIMAPSPHALNSTHRHASKPTTASTPNRSLSLRRRPARHVLPICRPYSWRQAAPVHPHNAPAPWPFPTCHRRTTKPITPLTPSLRRPHPPPPLRQAAPASVSARPASRAGGPSRSRTPSPSPAVCVLDDQRANVSA
jgi:hypothetical protein